MLLLPPRQEEQPAEGGEVTGELNDRAGRALLDRPATLGPPSGTQSLDGGAFEVAEAPHPKEERKTIGPLRRRLRTPGQGKTFPIPLPTPAKEAVDRPQQLFCANGILRRLRRIPGPSSLREPLTDVEDKGKGTRQPRAQALEVHLQLLAAAIPAPGDDPFDAGATFGQRRVHDPDEAEGIPIQRPQHLRLQLRRGLPASPALHALAREPVAKARKLLLHARAEQRRSDRALHRAPWQVGTTAAAHEGVEPTGPVLVAQSLAKFPLRCRGKRDPLADMLAPDRALQNRLRQFQVAAVDRPGEIPRLGGREVRRDRLRRKAEKLLALQLEGVRRPFRPLPHMQGRKGYGEQVQAAHDSASLKARVR